MDSTTKVLKTTPKTKESKQAAYMYAGFLVVLAVTQLFTFEKFIKIIESFSLPGGGLGAKLMAIFIATAEVLALPFLLRLSTLRTVKYISATLCLAVPLTWLFLAIWIYANNAPALNFGLLGGLVTLVPGFWAIFISLALVFLSVWSVWGLWPRGNN